MTQATWSKEAPDLVDQFLEHVSERPDVQAADGLDRAYTYKELKDHSFQLAGTINQVVQGPGPRVLIALASSPSAYAAMVGTLVAGGTFCPVDLQGPKDRNAAICKLFAPDVVLYEADAPRFLKVLPITTPMVDISSSLAEALPGPRGEQSEVAYVVFTTGSSGHPKGVKMSRRGFSHFLEVSKAYFQLACGERWAQYSNLAHDLGVMDVFMALTQGGTLVPLSQVERKFRPGVAIKNRRIAVWQSVPGALDFIMQDNKMNAEHLGSLRVMSFCGDALRGRQLDALFTARPDLVVYNTYGTTETMGFNTINHLTADNYKASCDAVGVAIGDEVPGWRVHLYGGDHADEGEIVVASDHLSLGYWGDEDQTRKAFRQASFGNELAQRAYFTGDWGVRNNGRLYCGGRMDRQVKIQGERIELAGVDELLREAGFADAYTLVIDGGLVGFVETDSTVDVAEIRDRLLRSLPVQAVPGRLYAMSSLPRQNGKIDRQALEREASR